MRCAGLESFVLSTVERTGSQPETGDVSHALAEHRAFAPRCCRNGVPMLLTEAEQIALREFLRQGQVRSVLERYFHAVDSYDTAMLESCFTEDAQFAFNANSDDKRVLIGNRGIAEFFRERRRNFKAQCHFLNHAAITVRGTTASADVFAMSNIVFEDRIAVRGLRYLDELVLGPDEVWRIARRVHTPLWQYNGTPVAPMTAPTGAPKSVG